MARCRSRRAGRALAWARSGAVREPGCAPDGRASGRTRPWPGTAVPASDVLSALFILLAIYRVEDLFKQARGWADGRCAGGAGRGGAEERSRPRVRGSLGRVYRRLTDMRK